MPNQKRLSLTVNLLPKDPFLDSAPGRVLQWMMSAGRYIVIFTELAVIISFAARFSLDRQITDLNEKMYSAMTVIEGYQQEEQQFRLVQAKTKHITDLGAKAPYLVVFEELRRVIPDGVTLENMSLTSEAVVAKGKATNSSVFTTFVNNLQLSTTLQNVRINRLEASEGNSASFNFDLNARVVPSQIQAP